MRIHALAVILSCLTMAVPADARPRHARAVLGAAAVGAAIGALVAGASRAFAQPAPRRKVVTIRQPRSRHVKAAENRTGGNRAKAEARFTRGGGSDAKPASNGIQPYRPASP